MTSALSLKRLLPSLQQRLFAIVLGSVLLASVVLGALLLIFTRNTFKNHVAENNKKVLKNLVDVVSVPLSQRNYSMVVDLIDGAQKTADLKAVWVVNSKGEVIASTNAGDTRGKIPNVAQNDQGFTERSLADDPAAAGDAPRIAILANDAILWAQSMSMLWALGVGLLVVLPIMGLLANRLSHSLADPIRRLTQVAQQVAEGDLVSAEKSISQMPGAQVSLDPRAVRMRPDETDQLLEAIMTMTANLSSLIGRVQRSSVQLMSAATQIAAAARQQETTVNTFGGSTSQIAASVKEISATSQELLGTMNTVSQVATQTAGVAASGREMLEARQASMNQLIDATGSISGKLSVINQRANDITLVVTTITKVADQTNLLSINAAIEAEKAGEAGLGFLVVAREIRRLADQTAVATLDIERMVREMQSSVSSGVMEMDKFSQEVRRSVQEVSGLTAQLGEIIQQVQALTARFEEVNDGMRAQSQGAAQINDAMIHLTDAARQTAQSLQEFNKATDHMNDAVGGLKEEVSHFKVSE